MAISENDKTGIDQAGENLFNFAIDREDVKALMAQLPKEAACKPATVEYELQILKIISVGWSISFFLEEYSYKDQLSEIFWKSIHEFSTGLSETTGLMTGQDIDYFQILKKSLDTYVTALTDKPEMTEPAAVIGPAFAEFCGDGDDVFTVMAGSRMFIITLARVRDYLESLEL